jgi:hypothetical protein
MNHCALLFYTSTFLLYPCNFLWYGLRTVSRIAFELYVSLVPFSPMPFGPGTEYVSLTILGMLA